MSAGDDDDCCAICVGVRILMFVGAVASVAWLLVTGGRS